MITVTVIKREDEREEQAEPKTRLTAAAPAGAPAPQQPHRERNDEAMNDFDRRYELVRMAYELATLMEPGEEVMFLLMRQRYERVLELMLILRRAGNVRSPLGFLRRAVEEGWTAESSPRAVDRRLQNREEAFYRDRGYNPAAAREKALQNQLGG